MAANSRIEWTECTWNPVTGCTKISAGCRNCYAERMARRLQAMGQPNYRNGFRLTLHPHVLELPLHWRRPRMIFVNSMSDLFHREVPLAFIRQVFDVVRRTPQHCFQILTKRADRLARLAPKLLWPQNIRDQCRAARIPFFFKQWGGLNKKANRRVLDDRTWGEKADTTKRRELAYAGLTRVRR